MKNGSSKNNGNKKLQPYSNYIKYTNIGLQMAVIIGAGVWGGIELDKWLGFDDFPLFTVVLSLLAVLGAMAIVIRGVIKDN